VRPLVEHNSVIWSPVTLRDIDAIESVQRRFTKRLPDLHSVSYADRLQRLHLRSLELRRLVTDLIRCYETVFGYADDDIGNCFNFSPAVYTVITNCLKNIMLAFVVPFSVRVLLMHGMVYLVTLILEP